MSTQTLERIDVDMEVLEDLDESIDDGQGDGLAHYVHKDKIIEATFSHKPVFALCGKRWVANRSPEGLPVCPRCVEIHADPSNFRSIDPEEVRP